MLLALNHTKFNQKPKLSAKIGNFVRKWLFLSYILTFCEILVLAKLRKFQNAKSSWSFTRCNIYLDHKLTSSVFGRYFGTKLPPYIDKILCTGIKKTVPKLFIFSAERWGICIFTSWHQHKKLCQLGNLHLRNCFSPFVQCIVGA